MNTPEKLVQTYLRLNGFFTIPHFSVLQDTATHADFIAVRFGSSVEIVGKLGATVHLCLDNSFLEKLGASKNDTIGLVAEVKGGDEIAMVSNSTFEYVRPFFGNIPRLCKVGFEEKLREIAWRGDHVIVPVNRCLQFISERFAELDKIDRDLRGSGRLTKQGSWHLSEDFLSDLLFLKKAGLLQEGSAR